MCVSLCCLSLPLTECSPREINVIIDADWRNKSSKNKTTKFWSPYFGLDSLAGFNVSDVTKRPERGKDNTRGHIHVEWKAAVAKRSNQLKNWCPLCKSDLFVRVFVMSKVYIGDTKKKQQKRIFATMQEVWKTSIEVHSQRWWSNVKISFRRLNQVEQLKCIWDF